MFKNILHKCIHNQIDLKTYYLVNLPKYAFAIKKTPSPISKTPPLKLVFNEENKALIFKHLNGENDIKWLVRGNFVFTVLNAFLFFAETIAPVFGGWNYLSFLLGTVMGVGATVALNVISKRTIDEISLFRSGDYVEVKFFNAYWIPKQKVFHISEFTNLRESHFGYHRSELTSLGKIWINLDKNIYQGLPEYDGMTREVLTGKPIKLAKVDSVMNKYKQYQKNQGFDFLLNYPLALTKLHFLNKAKFWRRYTCMQAYSYSYLIIWENLKLNNTLTISLFFITFFNFALIKHFKEGNRIISLLYLIAELIYAIDCLFPNPVILFLCIITTILYLIGIIYFPIYNFPKPTGKFKVGYLEFKLNPNVPVSVFYPTNESSHDRPWLDDKDYWKRLAEIATGNVKIIPDPIFKFISSFFNHIQLGVEVEAPITKDIKNPKVIIFIHGLASSRNGYSIFKKELASQGYIVFSPDITEILPLRAKTIEEAFEFRHGQLNDRQATLKELIDYVYKPLNMYKLFQENLDIDYGHLSIMGHSFGGTTAITLAALDSRITGCCLLLDPWLWPIKPEFHLEKLKRPLLCLKAEYFGDDLNDSALDTLFSKNIAKHSHLKTSFIVQLQGSYHHNQTDIIGLIPRELLLFGKTKRIDNIHIQWETNILVMNKFLEEMQRDQYNHLLHDLEYLPEVNRKLIQIKQY